MIFGI